MQVYVFPPTHLLLHIVYVGLKLLVRIVDMEPCWYTKFHQWHPLLFQVLFLLFSFFLNLKIDCWKYFTITSIVKQNMVLHQARYKTGITIIDIIIWLIFQRKFIWNGLIYIILLSFNISINKLWKKINLCNYHVNSSAYIIY